MPLPPRPHALVLGAHEDDVGLTEGLEGLTEQLSVGFLDLADDLPQRLPSFLAAYDAVVLGESSFHYARYVTGGRVRVGGGGGGGGNQAQPHIACSPNSPPLTASPLSFGTVHLHGTVRVRAYTCTRAMPAGR